MVEMRDLPGQGSDPTSALDVALLDTLMVTSGEPCLCVDPGLRVTRWSAAFDALVTAHAPNHLVIGRRLDEIFAPGAWRDALIEAITAALAGSPSHRSGWADAGGAGRRYREYDVVPIRGDAGRIVGALMIAHEGRPPVTAGRDERPHAAFEHAPIGMAIAAPDGTILEVNAAFARLLGSSPEKVAGRTMPAITHPEDRGNSPFMALARGNISHYEVTKRYLRDDGGVVPVHAVATRLPGEPLRVLAVVQSTESGPWQAAADVAWYRAIFEAQPHGGAVLSLDGQVLQANQAFARLAGLPMEKLLGTELATLDVEGPARIRERLSAATKGPLRIDSTLRRPDGSAVPIEINLIPLAVGGEIRLCCALRDTTQRQEALTAQQASEMKYKGLVERAPIITYSFSTTRGGLYYSPQVEAILGYTPEELAHRPFLWFESIHPDDLPHVRAELATLKDRGGFDVELRIRHKDGSWRWLREWSSSIEVHGEECIVVGQALDLTPLREQERRFQRLVENVPDILYRWSRNPTPHFNYISAAVEQIFGYTPGDYLADPDLLERCLDQEDWARAMTLHGDPSKDRHSYRIRGRHRDGRPVVLDVNRTVIRDPAGEVIAVEGVARDVTASVEAERRNTLLSAGLEQAAEVVIITDCDGLIIEVNAAFERVTGHARSDVLGRNPSLLKSGFQGREFYAQMWETLKAGQIFRGTMVNRKRDGSNYVVEAVITPIRDATGEITNYVGLQRDVSRERLLDEALRQSQKMEAVGQVTGGVAHDFNNMLTVILANANLLASHLEEGTEAHHTLHEMIAAAQHGTGLVRQLLAYGRKERLSPRPIRLADEFSAFVTILRRALSENIEIAFAGHAASWAEVDRTAFEQMLLNLATNARDAMPQGGRLTVHVADRLVTESEAAVSAGERRPGHFATISVADTGTGMPPEVVRRIFEPFFTTKGVGKGTGLGMSMVYGLMQQHGGWVEVESTPGKGTTVTLGFPVVAAPPRVETAAVVAPPEGAAGRGELILVVEDEDALRRVATRTLEREGFTVLTAGDGEAGWAQWQEHGDAIALILTDAIMPKLGGADLIRRLDAHGCTVPVLLMSGYAAEDLSDPLLKNVAVIPKPWTGEALARRIREILDAKMDGGAA